MIDTIINKIRNSLTETFADVLECFSGNENLLGYRPAKGGWTISEILVHISLTNHYLLILIRKGCIRALEKSEKVAVKELLHDYQFDWDKIETIGAPRSFEWNRPEHMEPDTSMPLAEAETKLRAQLNECLGYLEQLRNGEGILYKTMMSVNNIGKIDVYHYIYFLCQHAKRHISQMEEIKKEFIALN